MGNCFSKSHEETDCDINVSCYNDPSDVYVTIDDNAVNNYHDNIAEPVNTDENSIYDQLFSNNHILVAAIDFGTSYSGYAFSFRHEYQRDQLKISTNLWAHNSGLSPKAPSAVLIGPDRQVEAFGYEAHSKYNELIESGYETNHLYFEKFKMILYTVEYGHIFPESQQPNCNTGYMWEGNACY
ncbi:heat shock 70 kDa protein 12A-like isoform X2 [Mytilus galloprovincialis]|uniref:heat shock 70 kDa protein 12A-like isoform X2 n=1 Tax=Mytilus galloprovincialis TaxID=29158 RepID=UPI003F7B5BF1